MGHLLGGEKNNFLIRDIDGPAMTATPVESCRFAARRSLRGSLLVGSGCSQEPTARARALPSVETYEAILSATQLSPAQVPRVFDPELLEELQESAHAA